MHRQPELPVVLEPEEADDGSLISLIFMRRKSRGRKEERQRTVVRCRNIYVRFYNRMNERRRKHLLSE
jgi:sarcosine oxidase delta subunit